MYFYLICDCSDNPNGESEEYGNGTCEENTPPGQLQLRLVILASEDGCCNGRCQYAHEPPLRNLFVPPHELRVNVHTLFLKTPFTLLPYFSACNNLVNFIAYVKMVDEIPISYTYLP